MTKHGQLWWHILGGYLIRKRQEGYKFKSGLRYTHIYTHTEAAEYDGTCL